MNEPLNPLLLANLAAAGAVLAVLALRLPVRRLFGARIAYGLWLLVPLAAIAILLPARVVTVRVQAGTAAAEPMAMAAPASPLAVLPASVDPWPTPLALWIGGAMLSLGWLAWRQAQFGRAMRQGLAGPAVVGVLKPRIVTPDDFDHRYTPRERFVVLAHEQTHIARHDSRINAMVAVARCVNWFNPLLYVLASTLRMDQELACDAQVVAAHPNVRRSYAEAMLKTQLAARPLPLGCYWPATTPHPLAERIGLLARRTPAPAQHALGLAVLATLAAVAAWSAWASKPAQVTIIEAPALAAPIAKVFAAAPRRSPEPLARPPRAPASDTPPAASRTAPDAAAEALADSSAAPPIPPADGPRFVVEHAPRLPRERRIYTAAKRSLVEPGSAVRVIATARDPEGRALMADLTAFGSQHYYRVGSYVNSGSRQAVFTSVVQRGERLWVTASLNRDFDGPEVGTVEMRSGETRTITLQNGQRVSVTPTLRAETPEEMAGGRDALRRVDSDLDRSAREIWDVLRTR